MDSPNLYTALQLEAISGILNQSDMNFYRKICRWYSKEFHTPLHQVLEGRVVLWDEVLLHYYESSFEEAGFNAVYNMAVQEYIPELAKEYEDDNQAFADALIEEQNRTIAAKKKKEAKEKELTQLKSEPSKTPPLPAPPPINLSFEDPDEEDI